ncbi:MAG: aminotransferase class III-fold pyridoxal phosphate-dependent enzyme [Saprospiraceae bacterium]|nr:aminotransferase class III-fold pyridoxal phosphate-dependent enzyme [Saprospiraceae bacterium]HMW39065.1 aminotransferase class III-fold pyridoxal phosphate-dependent enzyme [Saprospiraceae bacterium]HMX88219.1 aminotransferase class III-fold pyridoxal phosphate-dependent enzyme [Saprospiraceae bacterium]HMZ41046.1 aminotransferase class III-fold pyridoxal phosphate-dependent enzyme [Saprospiraceae bacterium]HNA64247.1 aminotransferase class III-fold pyridoxal phosphate-dependent enzyme [Sa
MYLRRQFLERIAPTSEIPSLFEPSIALGSYLYDAAGKAWLDLVSGFSVANIGHRHPSVIEAIHLQSQKYLHTTVYGEHVQSVQVKLAELLCQLLPASLNAVYFLNSGSEAIDASIKLARRATGRNEIVVCTNGYHGSTLGAESLRSDSHGQPFRPLVPGIRFIAPNEPRELAHITNRTALVITEVVQAEAGVLALTGDFLRGLREQCTRTGSLLVLDEVQTGLGRTGHLFAFQKHGVIPDILVLGKALGAGLPLSAIISGRDLLRTFTSNPALGYISTFGGHPLSCAAALAGLKALLEEQLTERVSSLEAIIKNSLSTIPGLTLRSEGLLIAVELGSQESLWQILNSLYRQHILAEGFLFAPSAMRIAPPLSIEESALQEAVEVIVRDIKE